MIDRIRTYETHEVTDNDARYYVTVTTTKTIDATMRKFLSSYNNAPPNDYHFRIHIDNWHDPSVLDMNVAASNLDEAVHWLRHTLDQLFPTTHVSASLVSETSYERFAQP